MAKRIRARFNVDGRKQPEADRGKWSAKMAEGSDRLGKEAIVALLEHDVRWSKVIRLRAAIQSGCYRVSSRQLADRLLPIVFLNA